MTALLERVFYPALALLWMMFTLSSQWPPSLSGSDLLYAAGRAVAEGRPEEMFAAQIETLAVYAPLWGYLLAPLSGIVSAASFAKALFLVQMGLLAGAVGLAWRLVRPPRLSFQTWCALSFLTLATSQAAIGALAQNSPQITGLFLVLLAFERYRTGRFALSGALLALATLFTLAPLLFALVFVLDRNKRAVAGFLSAVALIWGLGGLVAGAALHQTYFALLGGLDSLVILHGQNHAPEMILYHLAQQLGGAQAAALAQAGASPLTVAEPLWLASLMALAKLAAIGALVLMRPRLTPGTAMPVLLMALSLIASLFGPVSWSESFLMALLLLPALLHIMSRRRAWAWIIALLTSQSMATYTALESAQMPGLWLALLGAGGFLALLLAVQLAVLRAVRFEPQVPAAFR